MAQGTMLANVGDIPPGEGRVFAVDGKQIAVFHTHDGEVLAVQPFCPHRRGPLADGLMGGTTIVCPLHDRVFDLRTGCGLTHEKATIKTYPVTVTDGSIWVQVAPSLQRMAS